MIKKISFVANVCLAMISVDAIAKSENSLNKISNKADDNDEPDEVLEDLYIHAAHQYDISKKERIWLELHLQERRNVSFYIPKYEMVEWIRKGVEKGVIVPFRNEEECLKNINPMTKEDFFKNLIDPNIVSDDDENEASASIKEKIGSHEKSSHNNSIPTKEEQFFSKDVSVLELMVDMITNSVTCERYLEIQTIKLIIPAKMFPNGIQKEVAVFKFTDLLAYFDTLPADECWINPDNKMDNMRFSDALKQQHLWYPQSYLTMTEKEKIRKQDPDPNKPLNLKKSELITSEAHLWSY
jgi:hypothetical protein